MKPTIFALFLCFAGSAQAANCPSIAGDFFCVSDKGKMALISTSVRQVEGQAFLVMNFGARGPVMFYPQDSTGIDLDEDATLIGNCPNENLLHTEIHLKSEPGTVPMRDIRKEGQGFRIVDSVSSASSLQAEAPKVSMTCDPVLF